jgi:hypothetical protein
VGYVKYQIQRPDPYLTMVVSLNFTGPRDILAYEPDNCVDNSLNFTIDDYGDGTYRAPSQSNSIYYTEPLPLFPTFTTAPKILHRILTRLLDKLILY